MASTPPHDHPTEFDELAGLAALDVLEGDERAAFGAHAATCERCQTMVSRDRLALTRSLLAAPEMDPSPDFKARLLQAAAAELAAVPAPAPGPAPAPAPVPRPVEPTPIRPPANVVPFRRRSWLGAVAAVLILGLLTVGTLNVLNQPIATVPLQGDVPGSAQVVLRRLGTAELDLRGAPDPGPGQVYQAWIIAPGQQPVSAGILPSGSGTIPLDGQLDGSTVAITREPGRQEQPTSQPILAGVVRL
jgi:anti-sigma-K factor RskA